LKTTDAVPAARSDELLIQPVGDETVIYDKVSKEAHCLKPLAAVVFDHSDGQATVGEIALIAAQRLGEEVRDADVSEAVAQLESLGLLDTVLIVRSGDRLAGSNGNGVSRRDMIRRVGFAGAGAAVATTLVTSIFPAGALAASGLPTGCTGCGQNKDCNSGHCCQTSPGKQCNLSCCVGANNSCHITNGTCVGGSANGQPCTGLPTDCPGGACHGNCTVLTSDTGCGFCPCSNCPTGSTACCS
jgi:hypothetical protein